MKEMYKQIQESIENKEELVMATILEKSGSAPREEGTKMLIKRDMSIIGTIGGGILEALVIKHSSIIFENKGYEIKEFELSDDAASSIGMVCGGKIKVMLEYIDPFDNEIVRINKKVVELINAEKDFFIITKLLKNKGKITGEDRWLYSETQIFGNSNCPVSQIRKEEFQKIRMYSEEEKYLIEPYFTPEKVYIFGAGHVGKEVAVLTNKLGFYTVVIDDRDEFANFASFPCADEVQVIPSYKNILETNKINNNSYIIILTRGHVYDKVVLEQMLNTEAKYIGMIGSSKKKEHIYNQLLNENFTVQDLNRVHSPIGLAINAQTPEEISISIMAEIIKVRREN